MQVTGQAGTLIAGPWHPHIPASIPTRRRFVEWKGSFGLSTGGPAGSFAAWTPSSRSTSIAPTSSPSDAPKGWTSRRTQLKMHVQFSSHYRPNVPTVSSGLARSRVGVSIRSKEDGRGGLGRIACTMNGSDAGPGRPSLGSSTTSSREPRAHQHRQGDPERAGTTQAPAGAQGR
jgi:hypothetical protein